MIKLIASICMMIDHIGYILFPEQIIWRIIGRVSMPMFAYSLARGYEYSRQNGTVQRYIKRIVIFTVFSQYPYFLMVKSGWNIGATWVLSLLLFVVVEKWAESPLRACIGIFTVVAVAYVLNVDYGVYGVLMPFIFRLNIKSYDRFLYSVLLWAIYTIMVGTVGIIQIFSCLAVPLLYAMEPQDKKIHIVGTFYYLFYPLHIVVLLAIKSLLYLR